MNILVVAAHPDDEVLGCGATMARHARNGDKVSILLLNHGIAARQGLSGQQIRELQDNLEVRAEQSAKILGAEKPFIADLPDNKYDTVPLLDIVQIIEGVMRNVRPDIIYTHHWGDVNIDHRRTVEAVESAIRPMKDSTVREVLTFEVPSATDWNFIKERFAPNVFQQLAMVDLDAKIRALMGPYASEMRPYPHPRSEQYIRASAVIRAGQSGFLLAEAFQLIYRRRF